MEELIKDIVSKVKRLEPMPRIVHEAIKLLRNGFSSPREVEELVSSDPAVSAELIKLANSPYYYLRSKVNTVRRAVVVLGAREVLNVLMALYVSKYVRRDVEGYRVNSEGMWRHALMVAFLSKRLSEKLGMEGDLSYTAGLLHDIGKTILGEYLEKTLAEGKYQGFFEQQDPFVQLEKSVFGLDHAEVGAKVLEFWKFPEELVCCVRYHHNPSEAPETFKKLVYVVHVSNVIVLSVGVGLGFDGLRHQLDPRSSEVLGIDLRSDFLDGVFSDVLMEIRRIEERLGKGC